MGLPPLRQRLGPACISQKSARQLSERRREFLLFLYCARSSPTADGHGLGAGVGETGELVVVDDARFGHGVVSKAGADAVAQHRPERLLQVDEMGELGLAGEVKLLKEGLVAFAAAALKHQLHEAEQDLNAGDERQQHCAQDVGNQLS